jgi:hypothetical protein
MTVSDFITKIIEYRRANPEQREGQIYFNVAADCFPETVENLRGTEDDCFYNDALIPQFMHQIFLHGCLDSQ